MNITLQEFKDICAKRLETIKSEPKISPVAKEAAAMAIRLIVHDTEQFVKGR